DITHQLRARGLRAPDPSDDGATIDHPPCLIGALLADQTSPMSRRDGVEVHVSDHHIVVGETRGPCCRLARVVGAKHGYRCCQLEGSMTSEEDPLIQLVVETEVQVLAEDANLAEETPTQKHARLRKVVGSPTRLVEPFSRVRRYFGAQDRGGLVTL